MNRDETPTSDGPGAAEPGRSGEAPGRREVRWSFRRPDKNRDRHEPVGAAAVSEPGPPADGRERHAPHAEEAPGPADVTQPGTVRAGTDRDATDHGHRSRRSDEAPVGGTGRPGSPSTAREARAQDPGAKDPLAPGAEPAPTGVARRQGDPGLSATTRWREVQSEFVDDPPSAVRDADALVAGELEALTARLTDQQRAIRGRWQGDHPADTEMLRTTLREYRALLDLVVAVGIPDRPTS